MTGWVWRWLDPSRERFRLANPTIDLGCRVALVSLFGAFVVSFVVWHPHRLSLYPWLILFPAAAAFLYDISWVWGMGVMACIFGGISAVIEGLYVRNGTACMTAFVFSVLPLVISSGVARAIRRAEDSQMQGRLEVRRAEERLAELRNILIPDCRRENQRLDSQHRTYTRLNSLLKEVPEGGSLRDVALFYLAESRRLIGFGVAHLFVQSEEDDVCMWISEDGDHAGRPDEIARLRQRMEHERPILSPDGARMSALLMCGDRPVGVFEMCADAGQYAESDLRILDGLAVLASVSMFNALLYLRMERLAQTDGLTGLAKRAVFDKAVAEEILRSRRHEHPFAVVITDIDHFRTFNNTYGHPTGDFVLREMARILRETMPAYSTVARWGGEEFVVLLPDETAAGAFRIIDRLRGVIADGIRIPADMTGKDAPAPRVTFSAGVVEFPAHAQTPEQLFENADKALYQAKEGGRDRVVVYGT